MFAPHNPNRVGKTANHPPGTTQKPTRYVRIRITKTPDPAEFADFDVRKLLPGEVLDVAPHLATLLIVAGNAEPLIAPWDHAEAADRRSGKKDPPEFS
jgi:hypothetical protein